MGVDQVLEKTVLFAEDDPNWLALGTKSLESIGYEVTQARDAWDANHELNCSEPSLVVSDLHMGGHDGDEVLQHMIRYGNQAPFVIASGTLSDRAKKTLAESIPSVRLISKEDFLDPDTLEQKLAAISASPIPNSPSPLYLEALTLAKTQIDEIPELMIEANRIKGRVFSIIDHFRSDLGDDFEMLSTFNYHGPTTETTMSNLHNLKNALTGMAHNKYAGHPELSREMLRVADSIVQILNTPTGEQMNLGELLGRVSGNFKSVYGVRLQFDVPRELIVNNPAVYSKVLYSLIENAVLATLENKKKLVRIRYDSTTKMLQVINPGEFPLLKGSGGSPSIILESTRSFGTGYGVRTSNDALEGIGQTLFYFNERGKVYTNVGLDLAEAQARQPIVVGDRPKVLFLDYEQGGRFPGIERTISLLDTCFEYVWNQEFNRDPSLLKTADLSGYFMVIMHPEAGMNDNTNIKAIFSPEVQRQVPHISYGLVWGGDDPNIILGLWDTLGSFAELQLKYSGTKLGRRKNMREYVDFVQTGMPSSTELDRYIRRSYLTHQLTVNKK